MVFAVQLLVERIMVTEIPRMIVTGEKGVQRVGAAVLCCHSLSSNLRAPSVPQPSMSMHVFANPVRRA